MNKKDFKYISMSGRIAYQLLCVEKYFIAKYPEKDFKDLFSLLWQVTNEMYFDTFSGYLIELNKSCFFEFKTYEEQQWLYITKNQFDLFKELVSEFDEDDENILETLKDQAEVYAYTVVPENTKESIDIVFDTIEFLKQEKIELPDIKLVEFSTINQNNGWGDQFDGTKLSIILNK